jgi:hypothetical protein
MKPEIYAIVTAINELMRQMAVDEERIEKLEAALRDVIDNFFDSSRICEIARKALEGKDE